MRNLLSHLIALGPELAQFILASTVLGARGAHAISPSAVPSPNLDLSQLGRVAIAGDFDSISLYSFQGQNENAFSTNGSQSLLTQDPNGAFQASDMADASIVSMCAFKLSDGSLQGMVVAGNFTSLGGVEAQSIALWNPNTTQITPLPGLSGSVSAVYCDQDAGVVYVGGSFSGANSTNALAWTTGWTNLPFEGFNGPVSAITKNAAGNIVFGGTFDGLGNTTTPTIPDGQVVNLGSGNITSNGTSTTAGFDDPTNIICKTAAQDGPGNTWLLADQTQGYWQGNFSFGFIPTKLRLYNTQQDGRGTKTFYFQDLNSGGILNLNYVDANGQNQSCASECPLPQDNSTFQDFHMVPSVGMSVFRIQILDWYGPGAGLAGIEMFQDDIYSFAVDAFNEPKCDDVSTGSSSTVSPASGLWVQIPNNGDTSSDYLAAVINVTSEVGPSTSVVFSPDIKQSGNYSITVYTPGCLADNSCSTRGEVNVVGSLTSDTAPMTTTLFQTNNYDKFDQIYSGFVDIDTGSFRPTVTLSPSPGQNVPLTVVAQRVRFELVTTTGGLNGLFEYNPNQAVPNTDFSADAIDTAGANLAPGAIINAVASFGNQVFAAGNFSGDGISNVMSITGNATALPGGGLNAEVQCMYQNGSALYLGGNFSNTADNSTQGLANVAMYDTMGQKWDALGAGVNGPVFALVPLGLNITTGDLEDCLTVNGDFSSVNAFGSNAAFDVDGFAVWVPSKGDWLNNIPGVDINVIGKLSASSMIDASSSLYAGQLMTQMLGLSDAVELVGSGQTSLQSLGVQLRTSSNSSSSSSSSMRKRSISSSSNFTGVYDTLFYNDNGLNITILGGSFAATASNGSTVENLVFINNTETKQTVNGVGGLGSSSIFAAMDTFQTSLFAGGSVSGSVNGNDVDGLVVYDLAAGAYAATQPPALAGSNVVVNAVATQPNTANVYVGGSFSNAGSLPCAALCFYDASTLQWNSPGAGIGGTINNMLWSSSSQLIIAGNLTVGGNATTMATYDAKKQTFSEFAGASTLPGPITALSAANSQFSQFWAAGVASTNNSAYLSKYNDNAWTAVGGLGAGTVIRGVQLLALTANHAASALVPDNQILLLSGNIHLPAFGNASAALFDGTAYTPFVLASKSDGSAGTTAGIFVSQPQNLMSTSQGHLALGVIVVIGLVIALALVGLLVAAGLVLERRRRRREGYVPMHPDRGGNLQRIPPESLLVGLEGEKKSPPML